MTYRIIQWSSGNVGTHALRAVAQRAGLELSGLYVYSANKVGVDAGQIAGRAAGARIQDMVIAHTVFDEESLVVARR